jgi:hypothetical protein
MRVSLDELTRKYHDGDDPWSFRTSPYEQQKFAAPRAALSRPRYHSALELACSNDAVARHLAPHRGHYTGVDGVERATHAAHDAVPAAGFVRSPATCPLASTT